MTWMTLMGVGMPIATSSSSSSADPQLQFFENLPLHFGRGMNNMGGQIKSLYLHQVNIPLSISLNTVAFLINVGNTSTRSGSVSFGLYSMNNGTLSIANSGSMGFTHTASISNLSWLAITSWSATQNITPGAWYFGFNHSNVGNVNTSVYGGSSPAMGNAVPGGFWLGRYSASTNAMPSSIITSSDITSTGNQDMSQPYIIITA